MLVSGLGISANDAENKVTEGYTRNQIVVRIFSKGKSEEYFLQCANGLVHRRYPNAVSEKSFGGTRIVEHTQSNPIPISTSDNCKTVEKNQNLCNYLSFEDAIRFALNGNFPIIALDGYNTKITTLKQALELSNNKFTIIAIVPEGTKICD